MSRVYIKHLLLIAALLVCGNAYSVDTTASSPVLQETKVTKRGLFPILGKAFTDVTDFFMGCDTNYITPQLYEFTAKAEASYWHDFYRITSSSSGKSMHIQSGNPLVLGGSLYWSIFGIGYSISVDDIGKHHGDRDGTSRRSSFTINTARLVAEIYRFTSGKEATITSISDVELGNKENNTFAGLSSKCHGINAEYIFNHKRYSWPAAFGENAVQRKNAGSWKLGFSYSHQQIKMDRQILPEHLKPVIDTTLLFSNVEYKDYAISFGYGYNWAFRKNCLFAISLLPSIGYRHSTITREDDKHSILNKVSTDLITRASIYWNNTKYFTGMMFEFHTYSYREKTFGLTNTYGTLKFILGFNFLKKKEYKR